MASNIEALAEALIKLVPAASEKVTPGADVISQQIDNVIGNRLAEIRSAGVEDVRAILRGKFGLA